MKKRELRLKKERITMLYISIIAVLLFSINKTLSEYKTTAHISTLNAIPILSIETKTPLKELEFKDYGWATYSFDIINGKHDKNDIFYVNEIDMEYYIDIIQDSGDLQLNLQGLYFLNDDSTLKGDAIPYVEGKGYGPFDLPYKIDDEVVLNPLGYYESKYVSRVHYMLLYTYGNCDVGNQNCIVDANDAGKEYRFHVEVKAYQKVK